MSRKIKIRIRGGGGETDAPTVDDLLDQVRDYFDLLEAVEQNLADDGQVAIQWRVVHAATASPITFTVEAFPRQFAVNVDDRAGHVLTRTLAGVRDLVVASVRPAHFTDQALGIAQRIYDRVTNGLDRTEIEVDGDATVAITPTVARGASVNVREILAPVEKPYKEFGGVEGYFQDVGQDGHGRRVLHIKSRLTGDVIKCFVAGEAEKLLSRCEVADVWRRARIEVTGVIHYRGPHKISKIDAQRIRFYPARSELPSVDDIIDPDFTGGLRSEEYLERLRNGRLS